MVSLTVRLSDETARKLAEHAAESGHSVEDWAGRLVEDVVVAEFRQKFGA